LKPSPTVSGVLWLIQTKCAQAEELWFARDPIKSLLLITEQNLADQEEQKLIVKIQVIDEAVKFAESSQEPSELYRFVFAEDEWQREQYPCLRSLQQQQYKIYILSDSAQSRLEVVPERDGIITSWRIQSELLYLDAERFANPT